MEKRETGRSPVMRLHINDSTVTVMFSQNGEGEAGVKNKVRDILTEAYEERFQKENLLCGQAT